jgi:hypothetical protein
MSHIPESHVSTGFTRAALDELYEQVVALLIAAREVPPGPLNLRRMLADIADAGSAIRSEVELALEALALLDAVVPLAMSFPNGAPAPTCPSPRQVLYLARLAT